MDNPPSKNVRLVLEYDGTRYHGFQRQAGLATIEEELLAGMEKILQQKARIRYAGRTDAGVHARWQVINFHTTRDIDLHRFRWALNCLLPQDIVVKRAEIVAPDFDARKSVREREYRYYILNRPYPSAFNQRCLLVTRTLDIEGMKEACGHLEGTHEFTSFCKLEGEEADTVRSMYRCECRTEEDFVILIFRANSFLRHMVRSMVGTIMEVGLGKMAPTDVREILESRDRSRAGATAEARGLFLWDVRY